MASEEDLLKDRPDRGDLLLKGLQQRPFPDWHRQQILEQLLINSRVHTLWDVPFDWLEGEFLSLDLIHFDKSEVVPIDVGEAVAPEVVEGLLRARGYELPFSEWVRHYEEFDRVLQRVHDYESLGGTEFNALQAWIRGTLARSGEDKQSSEYLLALDWNKTYGKVQPLFAAFEEFLQLDQFAKSTTQYLRTPIYEMSPNLINFKSNSTLDNEAVRVYRIATQELGVIPVCTSLRKALSLAQQPTAVALRDHIEEWAQSLRDDSVDITKRIQHDISKASNSLVKANALHTAGQIVGYISIPTSVAGFISPLLAALGFSLTCVAILIDQTGSAIDRRINWLGFGTSHRD